MAVRTWKKRLGRIGVALALAAIIAAALFLYGQRWAPSRAEYSMQGVDVSAAQGIITWPTLKARGADFAYIRATSGDAGRDGRFARNWQEAELAGVGRGAMHVYQLCRPPRDQATNFIATVPREENALPPAIAFALDGNCANRPPRDALIRDIGLFLDMIEAHTSKRAILHIDRDFEDRYRLATGIDRTLWLSRAFLTPDYAGRPWVMWQASTMRRIDGIEGPVSWDVIRE